MASSTAQSVTLARAHLTHMGVINDPYAASMLRRPWRLMSVGLRLPMVRDRALGATFSYLAARTLFFDGEVRRALDDGMKRVVIVGAGYDSRAWRLAQPGVQFTEFDHPVTQADKRRRAPAGGPRYVALDLSRDTVPAALIESPPVISLVEGVSMYLEERSVEQLVVGLSGPGNRLVINFGVGGRAAGASRHAVRTSAAAGGETFRYQPTMPTALALLERAGWSPTDAATGPELTQRLLRNTSIDRDLSEDAFVVSATFPVT